MPTVEELLEAAQKHFRDDKELAKYWSEDEEEVSPTKEYELEEHAGREATVVVEKTDTDQQLAELTKQMAELKIQLAQATANRQRAAAPGPEGAPVTGTNAIPLPCIYDGKVNGCNIRNKMHCPALIKDMADGLVKVG